MEKRYSELSSNLIISSFFKFSVKIFILFNFQIILSILIIFSLKNLTLLFEIPRVLVLFILIDFEL